MKPPSVIQERAAPARRALPMLGIGAALWGLSAATALADGPTVDKGDTAWLLVSTGLVLLMTIPGLALFYGGLVRSKNMLSVLMQVFSIVCVVAVIYVLYGYSLSFTNGGELNDFVGGFSKVLLAGVGPGSQAATFSVGVNVPELAFVAFQMTFACITPALIVGAFAERIKFSAVILFTILWVTVVYFPVAHMVWYWAGPDLINAAAQALADAQSALEAATASGAADAIAAATQGVTDAEAALAATLADSGQIWKYGAIDFAGGTVVHINAGLAGLIGAILIGKRVGFGREAMPPHSLTLTMVGAALLWVGWLGFNAGSNLEANGYAALAVVNTMVATAAAAIGWVAVEWLFKGKASLLGAVTGAVAGLVAVTPAAGFGGPGGVMILGLVAGIGCYFFCTTVKNAFKYDDALDVFGVHCMGGIIGAIGTGIVVSPELGGAGIMDYTILPLGDVAAYDMATQVMAQLKAVGLTILWSGIGSTVLYVVVKVLVGLRPAEEKEREGLDIAEHGERAYHT